MKFNTFFILGAMGLTACAEAPAPAPSYPRVPLSSAPVETGAPEVEPPSPSLAELLKDIEAAYRRGDYARGLTLVKKAFELEKNDVAAMDRIGSIYYVLGRYGEALTVWTRALPLEKDPEKRLALENSIRVTRRGLGLADEAFAAPVSTAPAPSPVATPATPPPDAAAAAAKKSEAEALYKKGVRFYAAGEYLQATTAFLHVLELDPGNADAEKALKRLKLDR